MKYLKEFENHTQYEAYIASEDKILPNVSKCVQEDEVHYNPYVDPYNGHDYVEIGGLKWATMNIGAENITDYGLYFQWGDISGYTVSQIGSGEGKKYFGWVDYKYCTGAGTSESAMTKYNSTDGLTTLETSDDAAVANWGGSWRMPTNTEFQTLGNAVNASWTSDYQGTGIGGLLCTAKNGSGAQLFFPGGGIAGHGSLGYVGTHNGYWCSSLNDDSYSDKLFFGSSGFILWCTTDARGDRQYGYPIRPVAI